MADILVRPVGQVTRDAGDQGDVEYAPIRVRVSNMSVKELKVRLTLEC